MGSTEARIQQLNDRYYAGLPVHTRKGWMAFAGIVLGLGVADWFVTVGAQALVHLV